jgi:PAS domain S-box-containing protein
VHQMSATYNMWLLACLSGVAMVTSYTIVDLAARSTANRWFGHRAGPTEGALATVGGIWYLQSVVKLALRLPLSLLAAILPSFGVLFETGRERRTLLRTVGNPVMGNGVVAVRSMGRAAIYGYDRELCFIQPPPRPKRQICACRGEGTLRGTEQTYRSMFNQALVGMFRIGPDGRLLEGNPVMASVLGYASPEELMAMITRPLWTRAVSRKRHSELRAALKAAGHVRSFEMEVFRKDGSTVWISANVRAEYLHGAALGFMGSFEDITERRLVREQSLQSQKLESVGQLAAGIAHEINTPVQYIGDNIRFLADSFAELINLNVGYARLLAAAQRNEVTPQMVEEMAQMVAGADMAYLLAEIPRALEQTSDGVSRVSALVGAMKEFSHPGTGEKVPLNLNRAIENTITVARNEWKYVADMKMEFDSALPLVSCHPGEFNQVVLNLIVNAAHAIEDVAGQEGTGVITIQTRRLTDWVEVKISDTGGGIPENVRSRIFDPFFTTKTIGRGTGQGLAIARSVVVDKHQGTIEFETEVGHGTSFIIRLPCAGAPSRSPNEAAA